MVIGPLGKVTCCMSAYLFRSCFVGMERGVARFNLHARARHPHVAVALVGGTAIPWISVERLRSVSRMTPSSQIRDFLMSRRDKLQPEDVGLPRGTRRRVPGLRREEVATLAGVSIDYYVQVERGQMDGVSDEVLAAIARALQLDDTERAHLFDLARGSSRGRRGRPTPVRVPAALGQLLDAITDAPAVIQTGSLDIVAANDLGRALYRRVFETQDSPNLARYVYLDDDALRFYDDWDAIADDVAAMLRLESARAPGRDLDTLVEDLAGGSEAFERRWKAHDVIDHRRGMKIVHDAEVGELRLRYEALEVAGMPGTRLFGYTPDPDHPATRDGLHLLASLYAAPHISEEHPQGEAPR